MLLGDSFTNCFRIQLPAFPRQWIQAHVAAQLYAECFPNNTQALCVSVLVIWTLTVLRGTSLITYFVRAVNQVRSAGRTLHGWFHGKVDTVCLSATTGRFADRSSSAGSDSQEGSVAGLRGAVRRNGQ